MVNIRKGIAVMTGVAATETSKGTRGMSHCGRQLPFLDTASSMFSVCRERPFFPIVAVQHRTPHHPAGVRPDCVKNWKF